LVFLATGFFFAAVFFDFAAFFPFLTVIFFFGDGTSDSSESSSDEVC